MPYEQKDMSASLFRNDKKTEDKHPGWKGEAKINGVDYWVSAWVNKTKNGDKWMALRFQAKEPRGEPESNKTEQKEHEGDLPFNDDIPF